MSDVTVGTLFTDSRRIQPMTGGDDRAVTVQIGAVLLLGILVITLTVYQATVVPADNKEAEFQHSQRVQSQMQDVRNAILRSAGTGSTQSASVTLGTTYPSRTLFVNPPPATGTVETVGTNDSAVAVAVENASATGTYAGRYWNGTTRELQTGIIVYEPNYNEFENAPSVFYGHTVLYNFVDQNTTIRRTDQAIIVGKRVNLVALTGRLQETRVGSLSVDARPISASTNRVALRSSDGPIVLRLPTRMTNETWQLLLDDQMVDAGGYVTDVSYSREAGPGEFALVNITLQEGETYVFRGALVGVGAVQEPSPNEQATYLHTDEDRNHTVTKGDNVTVRTQVRDEFNNPVTNAEVNVSYDTGNLTRVDDLPNRTDEEGRVAFTFNATNLTDDAGITVSIDDAAEEYESIRYSVHVKPEGADELNAPGGDILLKNDSVDGTDDDLAYLRLNNTGPRNVVIERVRIAFYFETQPSTYDYALLSNETGDKTSDRITIGGKYVTLDQPIKLEQGTVTEVQLAFRPTNAKINEDEYFIIIFEYSNGEKDIYYVQPRR